MAKVLRILTIEDKKDEEILRRKSLPVKEEEFNTKEFNEFLNNLLETAKQSSEPAGGIAANQVGVNKNVFYLLNYDTNRWELFINPTIQPEGFTKMSIEESCLSVPNREEKVLRLRFGLEDGRTRTLEEVGKEFDVTRERIRQIEAKALRKLKNPTKCKRLKEFMDDRH